MKALHFDQITYKLFQMYLRVAGKAQHLCFDTCLKYVSDTCKEIYFIHVL
jgi:hypothetical protein